MAFAEIGDIINFHIMDGSKIIDVSCPASTTIREVKDRYSNKKNISLIYGYKTLDDDRCLKDCNIQQNSMIVIVCKVKGGRSFLYDQKLFTENGKTITRIGESGWKSCYSTEIFQVGNEVSKVVWRLSIDKSNDVDFGLCKDEWSIDSSAHTNKNSYIICSGSGNKYSGGNSTKYSNRIESGSQVEISLDRKAKNLSFAINGKDQGVAFENLPNGKYALVIGLSTINDQISLLHEAST